MLKKTSPVKLDPRVRRTLRLLREALISLMLEKDYASISIKEITERAEVAYITFFRHYESLDQLLMEVMDESLADLLESHRSLGFRYESRVTYICKDHRKLHLCSHFVMTRRLFACAA